jgi:hypothetical protein
MYYYVVVTNTNNNATGTKTATTTSNVATTVVNPASSIADAETDDGLSLQAWVSNGIIHIKGLIIGENYSIYNISGQLIFQGIATADMVRVENCCPKNGAYIIRQDNQSVKIVY